MNLISITTGSFHPTLKKEDGTALTISGVTEKVYWEKIGDKLLHINWSSPGMTLTTGSVNPIVIPFPDLTFLGIVTTGVNRAGGFGVLVLSAAPNITEPLVCAFVGVEGANATFTVPQLSIYRAWPVVSGNVTSPGVAATAFPTAASMEIDVDMTVRLRG